MTEKPLRIGIAGLGTVGGGTVSILQKHAAMLEERCGRALRIVAVSARDKNKARVFDRRSPNPLPVGGGFREQEEGFRWVDNPLDMAVDSETDLVVEAIGGADGVARKLVETALQHGKSVVTANKALIAQHGVALAALAEKSGAMLAFEAAVAGGIPIIKALRDGLAANRIDSIAGILNATCNVILTTMADRGQDLPQTIDEAGRMGFLEADPSLDIDGHDAAHKLAILASLAFGGRPNVAAVYREGIRDITLRDMRYAATLGYTVKLLAIATSSPEGVLQRVHPCLVPVDSFMAQVGGAYNAIRLYGDAVGDVWFQGLGGGGGPTASSVVGDIIDIARGASYKPFTLPVNKLQPLPSASFEQSQRSYYLRVVVEDKVGALAEVTDFLNRQQILVRSFLQQPHTENSRAELVITTHDTQEFLIQKALRTIETLANVKEKPYMIRIEQF